MFQIRSIDSGRESFDIPGIARAPVEEAVVQAGGAALPELDHLRDHPIAAPERGQGDLSVGEFFLNLGELLHQEFARGDDFALVGNPGTDLRFTRARDEIFERLGGADFLYRALDDDLSLQRDPWEQQADAWVLFHLFRLAAAVVGKENEAVTVVVFQQYRPLIGHPVFVDGGQCHGVRFVQAEFGGLCKPLGKLSYGLDLHLLAFQATVGIFFAEIGKVHGRALDERGTWRKDEGRNPADRSDFEGYHFPLFFIASDGRRPI
jgi:hypothetical protein